MDLLSRIGEDMSVFGILSTGLDAIKAVKHPVEWCRDKIKSWLIKRVVGIIVSQAKGLVLIKMLKKVENYSYTMNGTLKPPKFVREYLMTDDGLSFLNKVANELLEEPLFVVGYKLGNVHFKRIDDVEYKYVVELKDHEPTATLENKKC